MCAPGRWVQTSDGVPSRPRAPLSVFSHCLQRAGAAGRRRWGIHPHGAKGLLIFLSIQIIEGLGLFAKAGWSPGHLEAFEFTDINKTVALGVSVTGSRWKRPNDTVGVAVAVNDASGEAKRFFAAGGLGILVGDGQLIRSGPEYIVETYYSVALFKFAKLSLDYQFVSNPAYNRDRGPVSIVGFRAHAEL